MAFGFFADPGLTTVLQKLSFVQAADGNGGVADAVAYFGSPIDGFKAEAASDPGVDPVYVDVTDSAPGTGAEASAVRLALASVDLATAVAGNPVVLGLNVLSGVANAVAVHVRVSTPALAVGRYSELSLTMPTLSEGPV